MLDVLLDHNITTSGNGQSSSDSSREHNSHQSSWPEHASIPKSFICPLTKTLMKNPVIDREGNSYEKDAILRYLHLMGSSPVTEKPLRASGLVENRALQMAIQAALEGTEQEQSKKRKKARRFRITNSLTLSMKGAMNKVSTTRESLLTSSSVEKDDVNASSEKQMKQMDSEPSSIEENTFLDRSSTSPRQTKVKVGAHKVMPEVSGKKTLPTTESSPQVKNKSAEERFEERLKKKITKDPPAHLKYHRRNKVVELTKQPVEGAASGAKEVSERKKKETAKNGQTLETKHGRLSRKQLPATGTVQHVPERKQSASSERRLVESSKESNFEKRLRRKMAAHNNSATKLRRQSRVSPVSNKIQEDASIDQTLPEKITQEGSSEFEMTKSNEPDNMQLLSQKARRIKDRRTILDEKLKSRQRSASGDVKSVKENKESSRRRNATGRRSRERRQMRAMLNKKLESMTHNTKYMAPTKVKTTSTRDPTAGSNAKGSDRTFKVSVVRPWALASFRQFSDLTMLSYEDEAHGNPDFNHSWKSDAQRESEPLSPGEGSAPPAPLPSTSFDGMPVMEKVLGGTSWTGAIPQQSDGVPRRNSDVKRRGSVVSWADLAGEIEHAQILSMRMADTNKIEMPCKLEVDDQALVEIDQPSG